jgi:tetratricopeptide (TPR) repeat protein
VASERPGRQVSLPERRPWSMKQMIGRHLWTALALLLAAGVATAPVDAQEDMGDRIIILVPNLAPGEGLRDRFGQQVARELRSRIEDLHTHQTVSDRDLRNALRQFSLNERDLYECITARQLAMQQNWGLVLCGDYENVGGGEVRVTASFIGSQSGETFDVDPFTVSERDARQAAQQILQTFDRYQTQLRHTLFCQQYMESEQWDQALSNCEQALAVNPGSRTAQYMIAYIYWKMERRADAVEQLEAVLAADPINQDALKLAGIVTTEMGDREQARRYFDRYMELNPGDVNVRLTIATEIANAGDPEAALRVAQQGAELEPDNLNLVTYIGHFATNAAVQAEAELARNNGQGVDPAQITQLYHTAAQAYEQVFEAHGEETDAQILERLVVARFKLGDMDAAIALGRRATELLPDNAQVWDAYSRALEEAGRYQEALAAIERTRGLGRESAALTMRTAMLQLRQGNTGGAVSVLRAAVDRGEIEAHDGWRVLFRHAHQDKFRQGQLNDAYQVLEVAGPLAVTENDRLARAFWRGYFLFEQARRAHEPMTAESARRAKPLFERALELFQAARGYERIERSADVPSLIDNTRRFIEIQDALIRRGR